MLFMNCKKKKSHKLKLAIGTLAAIGIYRMVKSMKDFFTDKTEMMKNKIIKMKNKEA